MSGDLPPSDADGTLACVDADDLKWAAGAAGAGTCMPAHVRASDFHALL